MLLLPTPVRQTAHGYSPELCKSSRPVPQITTFVFPAFTLNPFFSSVRATDRHCRKMRRNNKFGAKNILFATTIGERKIASNYFVWRRNRHLRLQVIASCRLMVINVYLNCQLTPQLSTTQFSSWSSQTWTRADNLGPSINVYCVRVITYGDRHTL